LLQMKKWLEHGAWSMEQDWLRIEGGSYQQLQLCLHCRGDAAGDPVCYCGHKIPPGRHSAVCISFCRGYKALSMGHGTLT
jgi:hypothetical protein